MNENKQAAVKGGALAKRARLELEGETKESVVTAKNYLPPKTQRAIKK
jgi:hypothetical protein